MTTSPTGQMDEPRFSEQGKPHPDDFPLWQAAEAGTSAILVTVFLLGLIIVVVIQFVDQPQMLLADRLVIIGINAPFVLFDGPFVCRLWVAIWQKRYPIGPELAKLVRPRSLWLAVPKSLWWATHFVAGAAGVVAVHVTFAGDAGRIPLWAFILLIGILTFGYCFAANVFLALAVKNLTGSDQITRQVWRHRLLIDTVVCLIAVAVGNLVA